MENPARGVLENPARGVLERKLAVIRESNVDPERLAGEPFSAGIIGEEDEERASMGSERAWGACWKQLNE